MATILAKTSIDINVMHYLEEEGFEEVRENKRTPKDIGEYEDEDENEDLEDDVSFHKEIKSVYFVHEPANPTVSGGLEEEVNCKHHHHCKRKELKQYLDKKTENSLQTEHVLDITRNFDNRVKAFRKNILMAQESPLCVQYYHDRVEFQAR